ncbi:hypothetical protein [Chryseobacterium aurantiacum]|uniref:hypothetical protein n=1 Tax=Chryseobacterium aurantiacum TaxID=2116499 RepID=UPI000D11DA9F|nr:hypothetical protein [Chryseobacterium aurantiacum]
MKIKLMTFLSLSMLLGSCAQDEILDQNPAVNQSDVQSKNVASREIPPINSEVFIKETTNHPQKLYAGGSIILSHEQREYRLIMQEDSNLVLYYKDRNGFERPLWATNTDRKSGTPHLIAQGDGNLVVYNNGNPLWSSNTAINGTVSNPHIKVQLFRKRGPFIPSGFRIKVILGGNNEERALITRVDVNEDPFE